MQGLMMDFQLTLPPLLRRAETFFGTRRHPAPRQDLPPLHVRDMAARAKQLAVAL